MLPRDLSVGPPTRVTCPPPASLARVPTSSPGFAACRHEDKAAGTQTFLYKLSFSEEGKAQVFEKKVCFFFYSFTLMYIVELILVLYNIFGTTLSLSLLF